MPNLVQRLSLQLKQSPQQVLLSSLLQLPVLSLEQKIKMELEMNPLLELDEVLEGELTEELDETPDMTLEVDGADKNSDGEVEKEDDAIDDFEKEEIDWDSILNDEDTYEFKMPREDNSEVFERPEVSQTTLPEHLLNQLHMTSLSAKEMVIGEYVIWSINEDGYLTYTIDNIAENLEVEKEVVEKVLKTIQSFDPPGIGARSLQECLLIQMIDKQPDSKIAIEILRDNFDDFTNKRYEKISKKMEITLDDIRAAIEEITKLNPKPGEGYVLFHQNVIVPDLVVERDDDDGTFRVHMNDWNIPHLRINNSYKKLLLDKKTSTKETRDYIRQSLESARWLINSIHQRRATILKVMETIVEKQRDFFELGKEHLKPMILKDIADEIGMDISTISRVTNGKYVQTEFGVFELKYFFSERIRSDVGEDVSNKTIKALIKDIIEKEEPNKPLNDQRIAVMLKAKGFNVARRTVAKYREQMMIPVSRLRRKI
jgi:RNA polymerase sigma-54 factor